MGLGSWLPSLLAVGANTLSEPFFLSLRNGNGCTSLMIAKHLVHAGSSLAPIDREEPMGPRRLT